MTPSPKCAVCDEWSVKDCLREECPRHAEPASAPPAQSKSVAKRIAAQQGLPNPFDEPASGARHLPHCNAGGRTPIGGDMCICLHELRETTPAPTTQPAIEQPGASNPHRLVVTENGSIHRSTRSVMFAPLGLGEQPAPASAVGEERLNELLAKYRGGVQRVDPIGVQVIQWAEVHAICDELLRARVMIDEQHNGWSVAIDAGERHLTRAKTAEATIAARDERVRELVDLGTKLRDALVPQFHGGSLNQQSRNALAAFDIALLRNQDPSHDQ